MSRHALRRATAAEGWLGQYALDTLSERDVAAVVGVMGSGKLQVVVRITGAATRLDALAPRLKALADAGATEVIVDVDWSDDGGPARAAAILKEENR